ncbi:HutD/Ves family protein [Bordetella petrii]|uniref:HutD/Ves family protein n=1 Tax=Bordetella petrii TaxID=94624 RepID=UPI001A95B89E|nr:HutD family protein [Bordetella petrii]MBO1110454.1 HutD family protein [Bordetella petrii]
MRRYALAELPVTPWKNGGGSTREVACWPAGAGLDDFDWRVSIASIDAPGPFSRFPGVDRVIALLEGEGAHLRGEGVDHRLDVPLRPFAFSGDAAIDCTLLGGASTDFNVMSRRGRLRAEVRVFSCAAAMPAARHGVLVAVHGAWRAAGQRLAAGEGLWWADAPNACSLTPLAGHEQLHDGKPAQAPRLLAVIWRSQPEE